MDRQIALEQLRRNIRPAFAALWNLDLAFADVVATSSDPRLGAIRLAWWRERLEELDCPSPAPAEPRLKAVASELLPQGIKGKDLSQLEDAWLPALEPFPWDSAQVDGFRLRGRILFEIGARLIGEEPGLAETAGELWSLIDAAEHCSSQQGRHALLSAAGRLKVSSRVPAKLRPLTIIAALAVANTNGSGRGFKRGMTAAAHRISGLFPVLRVSSIANSNDDRLPQSG